jgi:hypothetical protein
MHDGRMVDDDDFYEPDEPVEQVVEAFERGVKRRTVAPTRGQTVNLPAAALLGVGAVLGYTEHLHVPGLEETVTQARPTTTAA